MTVVLFEPHHDDCALFAAYTALREQTFVITVLGNARVQEQYDIPGYVRSDEARAAMNSLLPGGGSYAEWGFPDTTPNWDAVGNKMLELDGSRLIVEKVWAPLEEEGGHEHHNEVGLLAREVFGDRCHFYATYRRGSGRTRTDNEVIPEPDWPSRKYAAMACFSSQINLPNTQPWFCSDDCLREWIA